MTRAKEIESQVEEICKKLKSLQEKGGFTEKEVSSLQKQLHAIDEKWNDGAIREDDGSIAPGQAEISDLLNEAHEMISDLLDQLPDEAGEN
ncbi:hypothetical protein BASA50_001790 [Batrachochytrium salamandrivorans]|uniref:Tubulin-specific chaperone A n=1 Tax=Batrachochytrium salamandrivorans TaxID=1357716 RepID=A0ABQ8FN26_9FUNG|nr:hypothetical protein BASA62_009107 [Batrachochytrium salamandrivorans]KAH6601112.1 hypothetical protein BASA50_001790 [Batrachochytrium salamandrivorans]KAH9275030.1 hypothetical protein BASA83_002744 [Batrachochytrium salamandrivorans]KAJ1327271.1 hypothetical protein BSLG_010613 [Batrachochytrium salamandrivorans]